MKTKLLSGALILAAISTLAFAAEPVTVVSWGGAYQDSVRKAFFEPFMKETGGKIVEEEFGGEIAKIRAMVESNNVTWDVVENDSFTTMASCAEGIVEKIDWDKLGLKRDDFISADASECVVPSILYATVLAYDTTKVKEPPTSITAFFDLEKYPGKRGLEKRPFVNLEWALIADGVDVKDVYDVLSTPEGVDRAFAKLDTIKEHVVWWTAGAQPPQLLADGQVILTSAWNGRIYNAAKVDKKPFAILWDHQALDWQGWNVVKGAKNRDEAYKFIAFAGRADRQADQTNYISYGPGNKEAIANTNPEIMGDLPTNPENMKTAFIANAKFWADNMDALRERFNVWVAQ
ncbi:MAG: ABC transporter substrate-binding protein [Rhizobiales bacterium]|nr:ABC transporter substrate-binding protein [Hyphomicrobiales bacterium]